MGFWRLSVCLFCLAVFGGNSAVGLAQTDVRKEGQSAEKQVEKQEGRQDGPPEGKNLRPRRPRFFPQHKMELGFAASFSYYSGINDLMIGLKYGYFVYHQLELGAYANFNWLSGDVLYSHYIISAVPFLRYYILDRTVVSPYVEIKVGRQFFIETIPGIWQFGGGAGILFLITRNLGLQIGLDVDMYFYPENLSTNISVNTGFAVFL